MKYTLPFIAFVIFAGATSKLSSQQLTVDQKILILQNSNEILEKWNMCMMMHEPFVSVYSDKMASDFQKLFAPDATIYDITIPKRDSFGKVIAPVTPASSCAPSEFCNRVKQNFKGGIYSSFIQKMDASYSEIENGKIVYAMERNLFTELMDGYTMTITDTLMMELRVNKADGSLLINNLTTKGFAVVCPNCPKPTVIKIAKPPKEEKLPKDPKVKPPKTPREKNPDSVSEFTLLVDLGFGGGKIELEELNKNSIDEKKYNSIIAGKSELKGFEVNQTLPSMGFNILMSYTKGGNTKVGIATGLSFVQQKAEIGITNFNVHYKAADKFGESYNRIVQVADIKEDLKINSLNIPLLGLLQKKIGKNLFSLQAGIVLGLSQKVVSDGSALADFEGYYTSNNVFDATGNFANTTWILTDEAMADDASQGNLAAELSIASQRRDVGWDIAKSGTFEEKFDPKMGFSIGVNWIFNSEKSISPYIGFQYFAHSISHKAKDFYMFEKRDDKYRSVMTSVESAKLTSISLRIGIKF